jgi:predicted RNA-binding protein (virulence factor B family)
MEIVDIKFLPVVNITSFGSFLKWKPNQNILMPNQNQRNRPEVGHKYLVVVYQNNDDIDKYFASEKIDHFLSDTDADWNYVEGDKVKGIVYGFSDLGIKIAIDNKYRGLAYKNETFQKVDFGEEVEVYVKKLREDGLIDLAFRKQGYKGVIDTSTERILEELNSNNGFLPFNDKSTPEQIRSEFQMSKKVFKQTIGKLYKEKRIEISEDGIKLVD